jgi:hypothetical protein
VKEGEDENKSEKSVESATTIKKIQKEIKDKGLMPVVEEICSRQRYKMGYKKEFKRFISCFDKEEDEHIKKMRYLAEKKL